MNTLLWCLLVFLVGVLIVKRIPSNCGIIRVGKQVNWKKVCLTLPFIFSIGCLITSLYIYSEHISPAYADLHEYKNCKLCVGICPERTESGVPMNHWLEKHHPEVLVELTENEIAYWDKWTTWLLVGFLVFGVVCVPCGIVWICYFVRWLVREMKNG